MVDVILESDEWHTDLGYVLSELWKQKILCDVKLLTKDKASHMAHALVLAAASKCLSAYLIESSVRPITIHVPCWTSQTLRDLLCFIYMGRVSVRETDVEDLRDAAKHLGIDRLEELCDRYLSYRDRDISVKDSDECFKITVLNGHHQTFNVEHENVKSIERLDQNNVETVTCIESCDHHGSCDGIFHVEEQNDPLLNECNESELGNETRANSLIEVVADTTANIGRHNLLQNSDLENAIDATTNNKGNSLIQKNPEIINDLCGSISNDECNPLEAVDSRKRMDHLTVENKSEKRKSCFVTNNSLGFETALRSSVKSEEEVCMEKPLKVQDQTNTNSDYGDTAESPLRSSLQPKDERPFLCDTCGFTFKQKSRCLQHQREVHGSMEEKKFGCGQCEKRFDAIASAEEHQLSHTGEKPFVCQDCGRSLRFKRNFQQHKARCKKRQRAPGESHAGQCALCDNILLTKQGLLRHQASCTGKKTFKCKFCGKEFAQKSARTVHEQRHQGLFPYKCGPCNKEFQFESQLKKHQKTKACGDQNRLEYANELPRVTCSFCDKQFVSISNRDRHENCVHRLQIEDAAVEGYTTNQTSNTQTDVTASEAFCCSFCPVRFSDQHSRKSHEQTHRHSIDRRFSCKKCGKSYPRKENLKYHIRAAHTSEKPFECNLCTKCFSTSNLLKVHTRIHTGESPYECHFCDRKFKQQCSLQAHERGAHTKQKPYPCQQCNYAATTKSAWNVHMATKHSDGRPFQCNLCEKNFKLKYYLDLHVKTVHEKLRDYQCTTCGVVFSTKSGLNRHCTTQHKASHPTFPNNTTLPKQNGVEITSTLKEPVLMNTLVVQNVDYLDTEVSNKPETKTLDRV